MRRRLKWLLTKLHFLPDALFLRWAYWLSTGRQLNLSDPVTFNDKLNWLKLNGIGRYAPMVDKLAARAFVAGVIGDEYLVPLIGTYARPELIAWHELPERFVIKCTHGSHCGVVVQSKAQANVAALTKRLKKWLRTNWYWYGREPPYRVIPPRIMVEEIMGDGIAPPVDYKFMCFDGEPEIVQVHRGGRSEQTIDFYTAWGDRLDMRKVGIHNSTRPYIERAKLKDMLPIARQLARATGAPYVRVDLYHEGGRVYFSEFTFFDSAGFRDFTPARINVELGGMIDLKGGVKRGG